MERTLTSPACAYAPEFASRVGAILAALLALIARRLAGHPLLAPLSHRLTAIAEEFERLLADLAAGRLSCRHTAPRPHPENLGRAGRVGRPSRPADPAIPATAPSIGVPQLPPSPPPEPRGTKRFLNGSTCNEVRGPPLQRHRFCARLPQLCAKCCTNVTIAARGQRPLAFRTRTCGRG
jgi:hypothetical protein